MATRRTIMFLGLVTFISGIGSTPRVWAGPCREVRCEYDRRLQVLEQSFESRRCVVRDQHRHRLEHLHADLRRAAHLCPEERVMAMRAIHAEIRETHRCLAAAMRELECAIRNERNAFLRERELAFRACSSGGCSSCRRDHYRPAPWPYGDRPDRLEYEEDLAPPLPEEGPAGYGRYPHRGPSRSSGFDWPSLVLGLLEEASRR